jgi:hypothetical protein
VRNRGELNLVPYLDKWVRQSKRPQDLELLRRVARFAEAHLRQDDEPARYYIDKNPLNFRFLGLISVLLPQSRVIYCKRNLRDTALSIWSQFFARGEDNGYAYALEDIAAFAQGCDRLMDHWQRSLPLPIHVVQYEDFIRRPRENLATLATFLGLPESDLETLPAENSTITTSSAWQARQPIYSSSSGRWEGYAPFVPELVERFPG